ncbi:hypothetical protein [Bradyrhizobium sp. CCGUVB14]|uniref:hypothetical protein n=1 Tax=Bradyrhizobium sp. CCGUVB14 TaxID=2949628 RepID=UPI0020B1E11B|nr:hypothetical protein [Bradyrhizobium sp. CCGUVB14]MCP3444197.1 hypothetical protein [Bradyrhizobium sp. CCGUVB14]
MNRPPQQTNPFGPILLVGIAALVLGVGYALFGVGRDMLDKALALLMILVIPVVIIFGITGIVLGVRRLVKRKPKSDEPEEPRWPPQLS